MGFTEIVAPFVLLNDIHFEIVNTVEALAFLVFAQMQRYFIEKRLGENNNEFAFLLACHQYKHWLCFISRTA